MRVRNPVALSILFFSLACASPPPVAPVSVGPLQPTAGERVVVDQSILIVDSSASVPFAKNKAIAQSLVSSMPEGGYEAGSIAYGGFRRETHGLSSLDRAALSSHAQSLTHLRQGSPLYSALAEAGEDLEGKSGRAAITVVSDGLPTDIGGRDVPDQRTIDAARALAEGHDGTLCLYTIQVGSDPAGAALLQQLAKTTGCGSSRTASSLASAADYHGFQREVYLGAAPVAKAVPGDRDGDGVLDRDDKCPRTPRGAKVDSRGCWVIQGLNFATNSAEIEAASKARLDREVLPVLKANAGVRVRIDGHTDSRGAAAYNQSLSERRAESVRAYFVSNGIDAGRLEARGFGETKPIAPNDTRENLRKNRRTELTPIGE